VTFTKTLILTFTNELFLLKQFKQPISLSFLFVDRHAEKPTYQPDDQLQFRRT